MFDQNGPVLELPKMAKDAFGIIYVIILVTRIHIVYM